MTLKNVEIIDKFIDFNESLYNVKMTFLSANVSIFDPFRRSGGGAFSCKLFYGDFFMVYK